MNRHNALEKDIRPALDARLSGVTAGADFEARVLNRVRGAKRARSKRAVRLALAVLMLLAAAVTAFALIQSKLLQGMFGTEQKAPKEVAAQLKQPNTARASATAGLSLDEYLFDGEKLRAVFTLSNPTDGQIAYMAGKTTLGGQPLSWSTGNGLFDSLDVQLLGGTVDGLPLPQKAALIVEYTAVYDERTNTRLPLPKEGILPLTLRVDSFAPIADTMKMPSLDELETDEDYQKLFASGKLPVRLDDGFCSASSFLMEQEAQRLFSSENDQWLGARKAYQAAGWLQYLGTDEFTFEIDLSTGNLTRKAADMLEYDTPARRVVVESLRLSNAGGELWVRVYPKTWDLSAAVERMNALERAQKQGADKEEAFGAEENSAMRMYEREAFCILRGDSRALSENGETLKKEDDQYSVREELFLVGRDGGPEKDEQGGDYLLYVNELDPFTGEMPKELVLIWFGEDGLPDMESAIRIRM